ncbi:hypothetical protein ACFVWR_00470 [Leifsonia sp. NPDC058292]|uniref:hypothetical protein n=1 Tax=Leifsonia sp. NPDC058292 TaxID=3346428 RepID=UPI0036D9CA87
MTTADLLPSRMRDGLRRLQPAVTRSRRQAYRMRRRVRSWAENAAEQLRPASLDSRDLGRLVAAMTFSSAALALLFLLAATLVAVLYAPVARDALRAMGFDV